MLSSEDLLRACQTVGLPGDMKTLPAAAKADPGIVQRLEDAINAILVE